MIKHGRPNLVWLPYSGLYPWVDFEIVGTASIYGHLKKMDGAHVEVGLSSDWVVSHIGEGKIICNCYDGCTIPFYECLFTQLKFRLPFTSYE